jgi:hypothetical protein
LGSGDVIGLRTLIASNQQYYDGLPHHRIVDPVSGAEHQPYFIDAIADGLTIAEVSALNSIEPALDSLLSFDIPKTRKPGLDWTLAITEHERSQCVNLSSICQAYVFWCGFTFWL